MSIRRSFRGRLALRFGGTLMILALAGSVIGYVALREILYAQLDGSLARLAEIEAAATADTQDSTVHFHEELFVSATDREVSLTRYAEIWNVDGDPVLRTRNLQAADLPLAEGILTRVASADEPELFGFEWRGRGFRAVIYPLGLIGSQHQAHLLQVAAPTDHLEAVLDRFLILVGLVSVAGAAAAAGLGWWLAGRAVRPVMEVIQQAESLEMSRGEHRITAETDTEELARLVSVLNAMLARIDQAFENQRRFLADAGHEIRTPLTILRGDLDVALRRRRSPEEYEAVLRQTLGDLREASSLADDLITLARSESGGLEPQPAEVPVRRLLARIAEKYARVADEAGTELTLDVDDRLAVFADPGLLERALGNLVDNAIKYGGPEGHVSVSAHSENGGRVGIAVRDDGPGIPAEERGRLFERFYRGEAGRRSVRGSGLGLAIVKAVVEAHGGQVSLESTPGQGTSIHLSLPAEAERGRR